MSRSVKNGVAAYYTVYCFLPFHDLRRNFACWKERLRLFGPHSISTGCTRRAPAPALARPPTTAREKSSRLAHGSALATRPRLDGLAAEKHSRSGTQTRIELNDKSRRRTANSALALYCRPIREDLVAPATLTAAVEMEKRWAGQRLEERSLGGRRRRRGKHRRRRCCLCSRAISAFNLTSAVAHYTFKWQPSVTQSTIPERGAKMTLGVERERSNEEDCQRFTEDMALRRVIPKRRTATRGFSYHVNASTAPRPRVPLKVSSVIL